MIIKKLYHLIVNNIYLKIVSLILAFIVFLSVHMYSNKNVIQSINIGLSISIPQQRMIVNNVPRKVSLLVKGSLNDIKAIKEEDITIPIRITDSKTVVFDNSYNLPSFKGVEIIEIIPKSLDIIIEEIVEKEVPIQFNSVNELPTGYKYKIKPNIAPKSVVVTGPKSSIDLLKKVYSVPLNQASLVGTESKILQLKLETSLMKFKSTREVSVNYQLEEEYLTKEIKNLKVKFLNCDLEKNNLKPLKETAKLIVKVPYSLKDKFNIDDFFIYANLKDCDKFKDLTPIKLSIAVPHKRILAKYTIPDTILLKKEKTGNNKKTEHMNQLNNKHNPKKTIIKKENK